MSFIAELWEMALRLSLPRSASILLEMYYAERV